MINVKIPFPLCQMSTMSTPSICVIGNLNIDLIIRNVPKMPEWGQEVMGLESDQFSSGQAGYLSMALSRLGVRTTVIGNVGDDVYGRKILADLGTFGVHVEGVKCMNGVKTGVSVALVRADGERAFITDLGCLRIFSESMIEAHWNLVESAAIVCLVGLFCTPGISFNAAARLLARARKAGKITMVDTGWDPKNWTNETLAGLYTVLPEVAVFMPNQDEARAITGLDNLEGMARALQLAGVDKIVIKCGNSGSYAFCGTDSCVVPARSVKVYDAVGAGDIFNSGFLYGLLKNWSLEACLAFGNTSASLYISRTIDRFPRLREVAQIGREYPVLSALDALTNIAENNHD